MTSAHAFDDSNAVERFALAAVRDRWLDFLGLEHETLPLPLDFAREGEDFLVVRARPPGRRVAAGRIPGHARPPLFLQAAGAVSFFRAHGFWLDDEDLRDAVWDAVEGGPRLWLTRTPAGVRREGAGPASCAVLAPFLGLLFGRGRRIADPGARSLSDRLLAPDAAFRRPEFWVASAFRSFAGLGDAGAAVARLRTLGYGGAYLRDPDRRAVVEKGRCLLTDRFPRVFRRDGPRLQPGGALGLEKPPASVAEASRRLRELEAARSEARRVVWIAVQPERWDLLSRRAFENAAHAMGKRVERLEIALGRSPQLPDEWRRELFVPCGSPVASLRFYEKLAGTAREDPADAARVARGLVASPLWAGFASDPTGSAPLPDVPSSAPADAETRPAEDGEMIELLAALAEPTAEAVLRHAGGRDAARSLARLRALGLAEARDGRRWQLTGRGRRCRVVGEISPARRRERLRRAAECFAATEPLRRVELLLAAGDVPEALEGAREAVAQGKGRSVEAWFELSAHLAVAAGQPLPPWLEALEAERAAAGGRATEALDRLDRIARAAGETPAERRAAGLRCAELCVSLGRWAEAGRRVAAWKGDHSDAPDGERLRALRLDAASRARLGRGEEALALLEEAERVAARLAQNERVETALSRADVYSLQGRFPEESEIYARWLPSVLDSGDDLLGARILAREALGLCDRREFAAAVDRLEHARRILWDDPVERAKILIDLASALYHSGRPEPSEELLQEAALLAASAGREDLTRVARGNRVELLINRGQWDAASEEIEELLQAGRREKDEVLLLVGLHHRSRLALRRGRLEESSRDNRQAREIAQRLTDRLEIGELWLEDGDRLLYEGDLEGARRSYEAAAADPPDRCDSERRARVRLWELAMREQGGLPAPARDMLHELFARDPYEAAETVVRWHRLYRGAGGPSAELRARAESVLRAGGGRALADRVFGTTLPSAAAPASAMRQLRRAVALALAGESVDGRATLEAFGLSELSIADSEGREITRLGESAGRGEAFRRTLEAGANSYVLRGSPSPAEEILSEIALLLETMLYRVAPAVALSSFAEGWKRLAIVTADVSMEEPYRRLVRFAPQPVTVLVLGESGSGKEAVARAIHLLSPRASGAFVPVNVAAVPGPLLESELFGHVRGAFTGAERERRGLLEEADRGTIFFDEIGDLPLSLQAKLLRALQEREVRRLGENRSRRVDVRVVSATSRDLAREVEEGRFREDLYYRLHVAVITLPPLRERGRDAVLLGRHFLDRSAREFGRGELRLAPEAITAIQAHSWPGNVRELQNAMAQAAALAEPGGVVTPAHLSDSLRGAGRARPPAGTYRSRVDAHRRDLIAEALERAGGNRSRAARDLGLSRQALLYLIRELHVSPRSH